MLKGRIRCLYSYLCSKNSSTKYAFYCDDFGRKARSETVIFVKELEIC